MKSVRLDEALEAKLREASRISGKPMSTIIRTGIEAQCDALLKERLDCRLADVIGVISSPGGRARSTGQAFVKALRQRQRTPEQ